MAALSELPLKITQTIQLQSAKYGQVRLYTKLIGYVDSQAVMITMPPGSSHLASIIEGDEFVCRSFGGKHAFAFRCHVLRVATAPFPHLLLSYPTTVETVVVRKATRVNVQRAGALVRGDGAGAATVPGTIVDLSLSGAGVAAQAGFAAVGDTLEMVMAASAEHNQPELKIAVVVRGVRAAEARDATGQTHYGLEFADAGAERARAVLEIIQKHLLNEAG